MDHTLAKQAFLEIQARPYSVAAKAGVPAHNCYVKGMELMQRLGGLGYAVRGRIGETAWPEVIPAEIRAMFPADIPVTHFYVEILQDAEWRALDASFQPGLAQHGLTIGSWENGKVCFPISKLYTQAESVAYQAKWESPVLQRDYFDRAGAGLAALNVWFGVRG